MYNFSFTEAEIVKYNLDELVKKTTDKNKKNYAFTAMQYISSQVSSRQRPWVKTASERFFFLLRLSAKQSVAQ